MRLREANLTDASGGSTILTSALWGGLAGAAIGTGVALIENGNWGRDIGIGAGAPLFSSVRCGGIPNDRGAALECAPASPTMSPLLLPILLALALPAEPAHLEVSVGAGAGYDSNLDLATSGSGVPALGTTTLSAWADGGWSIPLGPSTRLYAGLRYDGVLCPDVPDFSRHVPGADLALTHEFNRWLAIVVSPTLGYAFYGDAARSGPRLGARGVVRFRPLERLAIRVGYARSQTWASDPVFTVGVDRLLLSAELKLARRTWLAAGYSLSGGDQVFYRSVLTLPSGRAVGHRGTGGFATLEPYQASATEHGLSFRLEQGLWEELYVTATYEYARGSSTPGPYVVQSVFGAVGYRF